MNSSQKTALRRASDALRQGTNPPIVRGGFVWDQAKTAAFDACASRLEMRTEFLAAPIQRVNIDRLYATQQKLDLATVNHFIRGGEVQSGSRDGPVPLLAFYRGDLFVWNGHHRIAAARFLGHDEIKAKLISIYDRDYARPNPVAELIQTHALGGGKYALEYVDADDQHKVGKFWHAHGVRLVLHGKSRGTFTAVPATFVRRGAFWYWSKSTRGGPVKGSFDLSAGKVSVSDAQDRKIGAKFRKSITGLLAYVARERREHER